MFCVSSIDTLTKYYELFMAQKQEGKHNLRIATIFSYGLNEEDKDADGILVEEDTFSMAAEPLGIYQSQHSRDFAHFGVFWSKKRVDAFQKLVVEENLKPAELQGVIENYLYTEREPLGDEIVDVLEEKPKILERRATIARVLDKVLRYVNTFFDGVNNEAA